MIPSPPKSAGRSSHSRGGANGGGGTTLPRVTSVRRNRSTTITASTGGGGGKSDAAAAADAEIWEGRSVYPVPAPPSGSHCVLQNDLLCIFGGLQAECPEMLFHVVPRETALMPSSRDVYLRACQRADTDPVPLITNQLSTTPGRYMLLVLDCAGVPLSATTISALLPVLKVNCGTLLTLNLRGCWLHDAGAWSVLGAFLKESGRCFTRLATIELSCNNLDDVDAELLIPIVEQCPSLRRIGLLKNRMSKETMHTMTQLLQHRLRCLSPADSSQPSWMGGGRSTTMSRYSDGGEGGGAGAGHSPTRSKRGVSPVRKSRSPHRTNKIALGSIMSLDAERASAAVLHSPPYVLSGDAAQLPKIGKQEFFHAIAMYKQLMAVQTSLLDPMMLHATQPATFEVFRRQTSAMPTMEWVTLPRYLCACFPSISATQVMYALGFYSEYSLTSVVRKATRDGLRPDQKAEVLRIFNRLDQARTGVLPLSCLLPPRATPEDVVQTESMLQRLNITAIDVDAFAKLVAPYLIESRRKRRMR